MKRCLNTLFSILLLIGMALTGIVIHPQSASAFVKVSGTFTANESCPATTSIKKGTNPGDIMTTPGASYPISGKNKADGTHYQVRVNDAASPARWVAVNCGTAELGQEMSQGSDNTQSPDDLVSSEP
ncbi:MAG: hypothetical protein F6K09_10935, partial [Merismopedia sp. SIO2A8]|nr:hypothetical protein [Merismopedia sp. SIO2A8]